MTLDELMGPNNSDDQETNPGQYIEITAEIADRFIDHCIIGHERRDRHLTVLNRDLRRAFQEWLRRIEGRYDYPITNLQARILYDRIQVRWGHLIENQAWANPRQHVGILILPFDESG